MLVIRDCTTQENMIDSYLLQMHSSLSISTWTLPLEACSCRYLKITLIRYSNQLLKISQRNIYVQATCRSCGKVCLGCQSQYQSPFPDVGFCVEVYVCVCEHASVCVGVCMCGCVDMCLCERTHA